MTPDQVPEEARRYLAAIQQCQDHPLVRSHFFQVAWLSLVVPGRGPMDFFALEFRAGQDAALIWQDDRGHWGAGRWLRLAHPDADLTCPPSPLALPYFREAPTHPSLVEALDRLDATRPA